MEEDIIKLHSLLLEAKTSIIIKEIFHNSGMENEAQVLDYGFFPLGNGILTSKKIKPQIMILGNDFGTKDYLSECILNGNKESDTKYPTIRNLKNRLGIYVNYAFFTNLHLGVRTSGSNIKRIKPLSKEYKEFCFQFFIKQLNFIKPKVVICLGHDVRKTLCEASPLFSKWKGNSISIKSLYEFDNFHLDIYDKTIGNRKFILIPHPCDTRNFKE